MKRAYGASLITVAALATMVIASDVKSGPQPGKGVASFFPLNISNVDTPSKNGKESCFV